MVKRKLRVYGRWAGNPNGIPEDVTKCIESVQCSVTHLFGQCSRKRGYGPGGFYCKQHAKKVEPAYEDAERCIEIRKRSKRGQHVDKTDSEFCAKLMKKYPEWYKSTYGRVFNETVPFGSSVRYEDFQHDDDES